MKSQRKNSSGNPGTEAFERGQKGAAPLAILLGLAAAFLLNGAPWIVLPVLLVVGFFYWAVVYGGARLISRHALRFWQRRK